MQQLPSEHPSSAAPTIEQLQHGEGVNHLGYDCRVESKGHQVGLHLAHHTEALEHGGHGLAKHTEVAVGQLVQHGAGQALVVPPVLALAGPAVGALVAGEGAVIAVAILGALATSTSALAVCGNFPAASGGVGAEGGRAGHKVQHGQADVQELELAEREDHVTLQHTGNAPNRHACMWRQESRGKKHGVQAWCCDCEPHGPQCRQLA